MGSTGLRYRMVKGEHGERLLYDQHGVRHAIPTSYRAAVVKGSPIYKGRACVHCGTQTKYCSNRHCVACTTWNASPAMAAFRAKRYRARKKAGLQQLAASPLARLITKIIRKRT